MPASRNLAKSIRNQQAVFNLMKNGNYLYASKKHDLENKKWLKNNFFSNLTKWNNTKVTEKMRELWKRQTAVNLSRLLRNIKPNTNIPNKYRTSILFAKNPKHIMWRVTDPRTGRLNWFTPEEVRGMVNRHYPNRGNWLNAANKNNYGIFMAGPNKNLFNHPLTKSRIKRRNVQLVRPRPKANTGSSSQRRNN
jgi:hypothetical protein